MAETENLLSLENVSKSYISPDDSMVNLVFSDVNLDIHTGESVAIIGPSGSGKSTLLNIMGTLDHPTIGAVKLRGQDLTALTEPAISMVRNQKIGFIFQLHHLLPQCTVMENVLLPTLPFQKTIPVGKEQLDRARYLLERVGLNARINYFPGQLSGGERQRTAVVRALINNPAILLADEPTGSLDHHSALKLVELLVELNREEKLALVMVTHSLELAGLMGRTLHLADGKLT